jgi:hypothetical protein
MRLAVVVPASQKPPLLAKSARNGAPRLYLSPETWATRQLWKTYLPSMSNESGLL